MTTAPENYGTDSLSQVGPLGGLQAGVIAGVTGSTTSVDPIQAEIDRINAARKPGRAVLSDTQYPTKTVLTNDGRKVQVYTAGPLAGKEKKADGTTGDFVTGTEVAQTTGGGASGGAGAGAGAGAGVGATLPAAPVGLTEAQLQRKSAYDILYTEFKKYGLESLVEDVKGLVMTATSDAEITMGLRNSENYKKRFAGNAQRIAKGLTALDEASYLAKEDAYQNLMREYGLPDTYWVKDATGRQQSFEALIANDVSAVELEARMISGQDRVLKANPEVLNALKQFYPGITNGDILAYTLDPKNALKDIQSKVTAAEIGGAALQSGLATNVTRAEELQRYGVDKAAATAGFATIGAGLQRGSELASIYQENPYTQTTAEQEIFNVPGAQEARKQRQKITGLEKATFGGKSGVTGGALARDRAGGI